MQRREIRVALDLVDQGRRDALILLYRWSAAHDAMADGRRVREVAGIERIGNQLESNRAIRQSGRLIHQLVACGILDPELALIGADAVHCALVQFAPFAVAGFVY